MIQFTMALAGEKIAVDAIYPSTKVFCQDYLTDAQATHFVRVTEQDIIEEQNKSDLQRQREGLEPFAYSEPYLETLALYRQVINVLLEQQIILFHGSTIAVDGFAYLFTAPSGTGKSTHVRLWREYFGDRAVMINDDKPLIRLTDDGARIYGTPWMGKHELGQNVSYPLKAICYLQRGETNKIEPISFSNLYSVLIQQTQRPQQGQDMVKLLSCIDLLGEKVSLYALHCTISTEAVEVAYQAMKGN